MAQEEGLWNLCLPDLPAHVPGTRLSNLAYAPLAEAMGIPLNTAYSRLRVAREEFVAAIRAATDSE